MIELDYFGRALVEAALAGVLSGLVGVVVVLRQRAFTAMALTHATFPGAVVAAMIGAPIVLGSGVAAALLLGLTTLVARVRGQGGSVASGIMLSLGFASGAILAAFAQVPVDVESFLTGRVLAVSSAQVVTTLVVLALVVVTIALAGPRLLASSFDARAAEVQGIRPWLVEAIALGMIGVTVVVVAPVIGAILAIALIVGPAAAARLLVRDVRGMLVLAPVLGVVAGVGGLLASRAWDLAAGASIALAAAVLVVIALATTSLVRRVRARPAGAA